MKKQLNAKEARALAMKKQVEIAVTTQQVNDTHLQIVMECIECAVDAGETETVVWDDYGDFDLYPHLTDWVIKKLVELGYNFSYDQYEDGKITLISW